MPYTYYAVKINIYGQAHKPEGFLFPSIKDYWRIVVGAGVTQALQKLFMYFLVPVFELVAKVKDDPESRRRYAHKAARTAWGVVYFTTSATWGYMVLRDTNWLPWWMGGPPDGSINNLFVDPPFDPCPPRVLEYALYTAGYHFGALAQNLFGERRHDFEEMCLHHIATCALYFGFVLGNLMGVGASIAFLHDLADIFVSAVKVSSSTHFDKITLVIFTSLMITWFVTRLNWLPYYIWLLSTNAFYPPDLYHF